MALCNPQHGNNCPCNLLGRIHTNNQSTIHKGGSHSIRKPIDNTGCSDILRHPVKTWGNRSIRNLPTAVVGQGLPTIIRGLNTQLAPLGINTEQVANTRNLEQALKSIIAQGIKQYGANPSTVDLQFAVSAAADIKDPIQAISATLNYLEKRAKGSINKADAAEQYLLQNGNLAGFERKWTESQTVSKPKTRTLKSGLVVTEE